MSALALLALLATPSLAAPEPPGGLERGVGEAESAEPRAGEGEGAAGSSLESLADSVPPRELRAVRARLPVVVDGRGDDEVWARAPVTDGFRERTPSLGAEPPLETWVRGAASSSSIGCPSPSSA